MTNDDLSRREVLATTLATGVAIATTTARGQPTTPTPAGSDGSATIRATLNINGRDHALDLDPRSTLLDVLRERLDLTGTKKGCDHGQCGACTVHVDGRRALACLTLAASIAGEPVTTIEGLAAADGTPHPLQQAFVKHDALQCGYCTSGQIMSGVACIKEGHCASREQVKEYMSGNLCRCGAYPNIVDAILDVAQK